MTHTLTSPASYLAIIVVAHNEDSFNTNVVLQRWRGTVSVPSRARTVQTIHLNTSRWMSSRPSHETHKTHYNGPMRQNALAFSKSSPFSLVRRDPPSALARRVSSTLARRRCSSAATVANTFPAQSPYGSSPRNTTSSSVQDIMNRSLNDFRRAFGVASAAGGGADEDFTPGFAVEFAPRSPFVAPVRSVRAP